MSDKSDRANPSRIDALLRHGIRDARSGNKEVARDLLREVVELDPQNEKAWFWLASVVETDEERITCLQNVVFLNPDNTRAFQILEKLEERMRRRAEMGEEAGAETPGDEVAASEEAEEAPVPSNPLDEWRATFQSDEFSLFGLDARTSRLVAMGGGAAGLLACFLLFILVVTSGGGDEPSANQQVAGGTPTDTPRPTLINLTDVAATRTAEAPTPLPTLPPTHTPTQTATATPEPSPVPSPPSDIQGRIVMRSGALAGDRENQPIVLISPATGQRVAASAGDVRGHGASVSPDQLQYIYMEYNSQLRRHDARLVNINGTDSRLLRSVVPREFDINEVRHPAWSPSGTVIAFMAQASAGNGLAHNLYLFFLDGLDAEGQEILRESPTDSDVNWPAWSPDAARVVYVADYAPRGEPGTDLEIYEIGTQNVIRLTLDGSNILESAPDWSPDGSTIVYSGTASDASASDIYAVPADGSGQPELLFDFGPNDLQPVWSPDGRWIAFTSDRFGGYDVFVYDTLTEEIYAVTNDPQSFDVASDWIR